ncbi:MAG: phosphopantothenoylcysteine decarboxylase [Candidatus Xenobia bacterium]
MIRHGAEVHVVLSQAASELVSAQALEWATGHPVLTRFSGRAEHIELCGQGGLCSLLLVAPATANSLGKIALGLDDTPVTTLATTAVGAGLPVLVAPGMHEPMLDNPFVQENLGRLERAGVRIIHPHVTEGKAKMASAEVILDSVLRALRPQSLKGRRVLLTAGPTREALDAVRVLTNPSSGRMGAELAREARLRGAEVTMVYGPASHPPPNGVRVLSVSSSAEMAEAVRQQLQKERYHAFLGVAAVSDYAPASPYAGKRPTSEGSITVELVPTPKILDQVRNWQSELLVVGFKAETEPEKLLPAARERLKQARADLIVANLVGHQGLGFETPDNEVWLVEPTAEQHLPRQSKTLLAAAIWDRLEELPWPSSAS